VNYTVITEEQAEQMFDEYLDSSHETYKIQGLTLYPSQILKDCDPTCYDISVSEFIDHLAENSDIYVLGLTDDLKPTDDEDEDEE
jgi:hypothetical protein